MTDFKCLEIVCPFFLRVLISESVPINCFQQQSLRERDWAGTYVPVTAYAVGDSHRRGKRPPGALGPKSVSLKRCTGAGKENDRGDTGFWTRTAGDASSMLVPWG